ncbi:hypothetical protein B0G76_6497 [Paraburkholderia sp. BL23I1N1]|uniref:hypothetical protein n=1 Tax=Paraburkholderia sp. BL23I1N1 TaxID=1938802 RepID=UPI000E749CEF|nr:hypothetical protein [Paraburkholderia sp. BL23I1N1]RKE40036.1 hypothetical protein B0G76_6497 [Paraburkholderia sp. BL23I1N1]
MIDVTRSDPRRVRFLPIVRGVAVTALLVSAVTLSPLSAQAQPSSAMTQVCTMGANNAKLIAQDRDAGVSKEDELRKAQRVAAAMPIERQLYAQAELTTFIDRLYGQYAKMPPQQAYDKYLAYCEAQAARGAAQVQ